MQQRTQRKRFTYPTEPPIALGSVLGAEGRVRNRRQKHSWAHELSGAHRRDTGQATLDAPGQRLGQEWWEELDISRRGFVYGLSQEGAAS